MPSVDRVAARLAAEIDRMAWRISRMRRPGVVEQYDPVKHKARARLNTPEGKGGLTPWCDVEEASGAQTSRTTLTVGQTVWVNCPNGDIRQAKLSIGTFSDTYKSSSQMPEETRFERDMGRVAIRPEQVEMLHDGGIVRVQDGKVYINC